MADSCAHGRIWETTIVAHPELHTTQRALPLNCC